MRRKLNIIGLVVIIGLVQLCLYQACSSKASNKAETQRRKLLLICKRGESCR
jgi:hypothetical protein